MGGRPAGPAPDLSQLLEKQDRTAPLKALEGQPALTYCATTKKDIFAALLFAYCLGCTIGPKIKTGAFFCAANKEPHPGRPVLQQLLLVLPPVPAAAAGEAGAAAGRDRAEQDAEQGEEDAGANQRGAYQLQLKGPGNEVQGNFFLFFFAL